MSARNITVFGIVQGVFFRDGTKRKAEELGIKGWVRNNDDGSVQIHAEGSDDALRELEEWCRRGPPKARVDRVTSEEAQNERSERFEIRW